MANRLNLDPMRRAMLAPLGAAVLLAICLTAVIAADESSGRTGLKAA
jgi:hypothetical protein